MVRFERPCHPTYIVHVECGCIITCTERPEVGDSVVGEGHCVLLRCPLSQSRERTWPEEWIQLRLNSLPAIQISYLLLRLLGNRGCRSHMVFGFLYPSEQ